MRRTLLRSPAATSFATLLTTFALLGAAPAWACGGCFSPPGPALVVQDAERILFVQDPTSGKTTVTIEVRYSGPAEDFAWVLPLPKQPKVGVGTAYVFDRLDQATAPRFRTVRSFESEGCSFADSNASFGCSDFAGSDDAGGRATNAGGIAFPGEDGDGVKVLERSQAGPYDYVVLQGSEGAKLLKWLNDNGFATPDKAKPILDSHGAKGDTFVAFKLQNGKGIAEIRPVVLEMQDADPCVPLRLTAIAAAEDMAVVVYTVGPGRAVPKNHLDVTPNPLRLRWDGGVQNYVQVVAAAIDEAAGRAFVTEFAAPSASLKIPEPEQLFGADSTALYAKPLTLQSGQQLGEDVVQNGENLSSSMWRSGALFGKERFTLTGLDKVQDAAGLANWLQSTRFPVVAETAAIFEERTGLAAANGKADNALAFWIGVRGGIPNDTQLKGGGAKLDGATLAKDLEVGIVEPIFVVADALAASGATLTRMHMRISPEEMDRDPIFAFNQELPAVDTDWRATLSDVCDKSKDFADAVRLRFDRGPLDGGGWILRERQVDFSSNGNQQRSTLLSRPTTEDARWKDAPAALRVAVLDETGPARAVPPSKVEIVDGAILAAQPGTPNLPTAFDLAPAAGEATSWQPPVEDPHASLQTDASSAHGVESTCSGGPRGRAATGALFALLLAAGALLWRRRTTQNHP
ncbi:MAG: DUF2330 domain-containing protein [Deltaproteobacteria bacterium]|nr:DUF2330 domain-containing protein [Deltaproteobacteria bacterium]